MTDKLVTLLTNSKAFVNVIGSNRSTDARPAPETACILLIIPGRLFRDCIQSVLQRPNRIVVSDCENWRQVDEKLQSLPQPDLVIVGADPAGMAETFTGVRELKSRLPQARWIVLTPGTNPEFVRQAVDVGVDGLLLEDSPGEMLQLLTELVLLAPSGTSNGHTRAPTDHLLNGNGHSRPPLPATPPMRVMDGHQDDRRAYHHDDEPRRTNHQGLSVRENEILQCVAEGCTNKVIARQLHITEATVKAHVKALFRKMKVTNRTQAAIAAPRFLAIRDLTPAMLERRDVASMITDQSGVQGAAMTRMNGFRPQTGD